MREIEKKKLFKNKKTGLLLSLFAFLILSLLTSQLFQVMNNYYPIPWKILILVSIIGIKLGLIQGMRRKKGSSLFLGIITYLICYRQSLIPQLLAVGIIIVIYRLSYGMIYWIKKLDFDPESQTRQAKNYLRNIAGFKYLQGLIILIDILLIVSWLADSEVNKGMTAVGGLIVAFQFIFLGIAYYQKKWISWQLEKKRVEPWVLSRTVYLLTGIVSFFFILALLLPVNYGVRFWPWLGKESFQLIKGVNLKEFKALESLGKLSLPDVGERGIFSFLAEIRIPGFLIAAVRIGLGLGIAVFLLLGFVFLTAVIKVIFEYIRKDSRRIWNFPRQVFQIFKRMIKGWKQLLSGGAKKIAVRWRNARKETKEEELTEKILLSNTDWVPKNHREEIAALFIRIQKLFNQQGLYRKESQTLEEYLQKIRKEFSNFNLQIGQVKYLVERALYGGKAMTELHVKKMEYVVNTLEEKI